MDLTLSNIAFQVADDFRNGQLDHLKGKSWEDTWQNLQTELERRCPGHTDYATALNEGFTASR